MNQNNNFKFNTDPILNEIDLIMKRGINEILKDFMDRFNLLENTHRQIMLLPSVLSELNKKNDSDSEDSYIDDKPIFVSIAEMTKNLVRDEINVVEKNLKQLESKYDSLIPLLDKVMTTIETFNEKLNKIENIQLKHVPNIECNVSIEKIDFKENIKLEIAEDENENEEHYILKSDDELENQEEKEELEDQEEQEQKELEEQDQEEKEEEELQEEEEEELEEEELEEEELEDQEEEEEEELEDQEEVEDQEEKEEELEDQEELEVESENESEEEVETENESEEEVESENESEEEVELKETKEKIVDNSEEEEELFEIEIDDITYCTNNEENGYIYELTEDGESGEKVGYLKDGEPFFYADEKKE